MKEEVQVGIVGTGIYLPKQFKTAKDISEATNGVWSEDAVYNKLGIKKVLYANKDEGSQEMGYLAAKDCLERTGVDPLDIDVILCITEEYKEYPLTTSALYIQGMIGADNAWGIDVQNRCCTTVSAMKIAKDMLIADPEINTILIAGGYRNGDLVDYSDNNMSMMYNLSAGGGALIMQKNYPHNLMLGSHMIGDGTLARTAGVEIGGQANPLTAENWAGSLKSLRLLDADAMKKRLNVVSMPNWFKCIDESLRKSNLKRNDVNFWAILHMKRSGHMFMLSELGATEDQSIYLEDYGHIGQIDQILALDLGVKEGKIKAGDNVGLIAAGIGYVWASCIVKWG